MNYTRLIPAIAGFTLLAATANAAPFSTFAVGAGVGSYGPGVGLTTNLIQNHLNLNLGVDHFNYGTHLTSNGARFKGDATIGGESVTLSYFPLSGVGIHVDAGLVINQNSVSVNATPEAGGSYTFNGNIYTASQVGYVTGKTHFEKVAPYIGVGFGNPIAGSSRWTIVANVGAIHEGSPSIRLTAAGAASNPALASDIAKTQSSLNSDLNWLAWYPVVSVGVTYRF